MHRLTWLAVFALSACVVVSPVPESPSQPAAPAAQAAQNLVQITLNPTRPDGKFVELDQGRFVLLKNQQVLLESIPARGLVSFAPVQEAPPYEYEIRQATIIGVRQSAVPIGGQGGIVHSTPETAVPIGSQGGFWSLAETTSSQSLELGQQVSYRGQISEDLRQARSVSLAYALNETNIINNQGIVNIGNSTCSIQNNQVKSPSRSTDKQSVNCVLPGSTP